MKDIDIINFVIIAIIGVMTYENVCIMLTLYDILKILRANQKTLEQELKKR